jgi:uncharacterized membrane protein YbaN (DUF454 family)
MFSRTVFSRIVMGLVGFTCLILGVIGLVLPFLPGFIFFGIGIICLAGADPRLNKLLAKQPRIGLFMQRINNSSGLAFTRRCKIALAASAEVFVGRRRSRQ